MKITIDLSNCDNKEQLLTLLGTTLRLPEWWGKNWDALYDCLLNMEIDKKETSTIIEFVNTNNFEDKNRVEYEIFSKLINDVNIVHFKLKKDLLFELKR
jgi:RNAse (barnase) inhibitor barstar